MRAAQFLLIVGCLLVASAPAYAHGDALLVVVALASAPILLLVFLPILAMAGMEGRRWKALGLYLIVLVVALLLQVQSWYHPFARLFPELDWLQDRMPEFILIPPLNVLLWLVLAEIAAYLVLRDRSVPIGLALPPGRNLLWGSIFSIVAVGLWSYVLFDTHATSWIRTWPEEIKMPFFLVWVFIVPVVLVFVAIRLFRDGVPQFHRSRPPR
jgi:hypothetical protein